VLLGTKPLLREPLDVMIHTISILSGMEQVKVAMGFKQGGDNELRKNKEPNA
jgi:hypothetical protein